MELKQYIEERIKVNKLPINVDDALMNVRLYKDIYPDLDEKQRFFQYLLNHIGGVINEIDHDISEILGFLKVHISKDNNIVYLKFFTEEDYYNWLESRTMIYQALSNSDVRILNFIELSTLDFISDISTLGQYKLYKDKTVINFNKTGYSADTVKSSSFIKYLGSQYKKGFNFKPL